MSQWVDGKQLALHLGITEGRVSQLKKSNVLRVGLNKKFDLAESTKNYLASKTNAPRIDKAPGLPLDDPGPKAAAPSPSAILVTPEIAEDQKIYHKNRARLEKIRADKAQDAYDVSRALLVNTELFLPLVRGLGMKTNAAAKSILLSAPKRIALEMPDPKMRPVAETVANEVIKEVLTALSEIDPQKILNELMTQT